MSRDRQQLRGLPRQVSAHRVEIVRAPCVRGQGSTACHSTGACRSPPGAPHSTAWNRTARTFQFKQPRVDLGQAVGCEVHELCGLQIRPGRRAPGEITAQKQPVRHGDAEPFTGCGPGPFPAWSQEHVTPPPYAHRRWAALPPTPAATTATRQRQPSPATVLSPPAVTAQHARLGTHRPTCSVGGSTTPCRLCRCELVRSSSVTAAPPSPPPAPESLADAAAATAPSVAGGDAWASSPAIALGVCEIP